MTPLPATILGQRGTWRGPYGGGDLEYYTWRGEPNAMDRFTAEATASPWHPDPSQRWLVEAWSRHGGSRRYVGRGATLGEALEDLREVLADLREALADLREVLAEASTIDRQVAALPHGEAR